MQTQAERSSLLARFFCRAADWFATPFAILAIPFACAAWLRVWDEASLTLALSILAITMTQLVLFSQKANDRASKARDEARDKKIDGLIKGIPDVPDDLMGIEKIQN